MTRRYEHSISSYTVSDECVWIVITGGFNHYNPERSTANLISGPDTTVLVELGMLTVLNNLYIKTVRKCNMKLLEVLSDPIIIIL